MTATVPDPAVVIVQLKTIESTNGPTVAEQIEIAKRNAATWEEVANKNAALAAQWEAVARRSASTVAILSRILERIRKRSLN